MTKYIKIDWPEYQYFMEYPDFREICFFCAEDNSYFIPEDLYENSSLVDRINCELIGIKNDNS